MLMARPIYTSAPYSLLVPSRLQLLLQVRRVGATETEETTPLPLLDFSIGAGEMPTLDEVLAMQVKVLPTQESIDEAQLCLRVLYSFMETISPVKQALKDKLARLETDLARTNDRKAELQLKARRTPVANDIVSVGKKEARVVTKAREFYKGINAAGGTPEAPPNRYMQSMKQ